MKFPLSAPLVRSIVLFLAGISLLFIIGCAKKSKPVTKVTVAGEATSQVEPDVAVVVISIVTHGSQAIAAQQENARKSEGVTNAIKTTGGANVEVKTSDYTLQPQYDRRDNRLPLIVGYDARNSIIATLAELKNVGAVIDAASRAGAAVDSVSFVLRETSPARGQALGDATRQAMNKARSIAQALGGRVLRVVEENEVATASGSSTNAFTIADNYDSRAPLRTPIEAGHLNVNAHVQLVVEIES